MNAVVSYLRGLLGIVQSKSDLKGCRVSSVDKYCLAENSVSRGIFNFTLLLRDFCILGRCCRDKFRWRLALVMILGRLAWQILSPVVMGIPSGTDAASFH